ncbi:endo-beta-N-acetylglucosaminidase [Williamsoniiplasma luminosum]|uniref:Uncharacterized protein n=1 Tax=Williamsoniiplasma luminosum TaxID=214888 RepID=A0A2S0NIZ1_9MOLU|nr:hypothetical protein [Williamsoniiplasma luminosum]AVP48982.1 MAG: hypothetical protein C5T88_00030 [Williamsoniiplasma luminosum]
MKKLLSMLAACTVTIAPVSALVVSCTPTANKPNAPEKIKEFKEKKDPEHIGNKMTIDSNFSTNYKTPKDLENQSLTGIPLSKYWMPEGQKNNTQSKNEETEKLINSFYEYDPLKDKDAKYNVSKVPLKQKLVSKVSNPFSDKTGKVRHHAMGVVNRGTSGTAAQGTRSFDNYNFTNWAYVDEYSAWAGSVHEGIIVLPSADIIDAAHINGTKMLGMIYLDGFHGLEQHHIKNFLQKDANGNYLLVDQLIKIADYFGFDGWYLNNEANAHGVIMSEDEIIEMFTQYKKKVTALKLKQMMTTYQNGLGLNEWDSDTASKYLKNSDSYVSDFGQTNGQQTDDFIKKNNLGELRFNSMAMHNANHTFNNIQNGGKYDFRNLVQIQKGEDGVYNEYTNSLGSFATSDTWKDFTGPQGGFNDIRDLEINNKFHENDNLLFSGENRDPSQIHDDSSAISGIIGERTPLIDEEFSTNFSTGQGIKYFTKGKAENIDKSWNNRGVMDVQPTFQWIVDNQGGNALKANYNYQNAFNKGNSIGLAGSFDNKTGSLNGGVIKQNGVTKIDLFSSKIKITDQVMKLAIDAKTDNEDLMATKNIKPKMILEFEDKEKVALEPSKVDKVESNTWNMLEFNLDAHKGKTLVGINIEITSMINSDNAKIDLGQLSLLKPTTKTVEFVPDLNFEYVVKQKNDEGAETGEASIRLYWDFKKDDHDVYEIYQITNDGKHKFMGTTRTNAYFIEKVKIADGMKFGVKAVGMDNVENYKMTIREAKL